MSREDGCLAVLHSRLGGQGACSPRKFGNFRCSKPHSGAFWDIQRSTQSFLRRDSSSLLAELLEHWKPSPSTRAYTIIMSIIYANTIVLVYACNTWMHKSVHTRIAVIDDTSHKPVFWMKTSACRDGTLKNQPNKMGMTQQHIHTIPTSCASLPTIVCRNFEQYWICMVCWEF